jgi:hypothetical protein
VPLKHHCETALLLLLAAFIACIGLALSVIPPLSFSLFPFAILFALSALYPLSLQTYLRTRRADYELRLLHYFPVAMILLWALLSQLASVHSFFQILFTGVFLFSAFPLVALGFFLLGFFSIHVLRRWGLRLSGLIVLFSLYSTLVFSSFSTTRLHSLRTALLQPNFTASVLTLPESAFRYTSSVFSSLFLAPPSEIALDGQKSSGQASAGFSSSRSSHLPKSGPEEMALLLLPLLALYSTILHRRSIV